MVNSGLQAGFRESGILNIISKGSQEAATPMVGIRSMGLGFESLAGLEANGQRQMIVSKEYLQILVDLAKERFVENTRRIERFRTLFLEAVKPASAQRTNADGQVWEDAATRRERLKSEGLRRQQMKRAEEQAEQGGHQSDDLNLEALSMS